MDISVIPERYGSLLTVSIDGAYLSHRTRSREHGLTVLTSFGLNKDTSGHEASEYLYHPFSLPSAAQFIVPAENWTDLGQKEI